MVVYSALLLAALVVASPWWLWRMATSGHYRAGLGGRVGWIPSALDDVRERRESQAGLLWLHAVSVGEVLAAQSLIAQWRLAMPAWEVVVSTTTATGQKLAQERLDVPVFYFPLDFAFAIRSYLRALRPTLFISMESELWPRMLTECARARVPVAVVNARVSDRSLPRYLRLRRLWKPLLETIALFCAHGQESADRLIAIGVPAERIRVTGNLKYDSNVSLENPMIERVHGLVPNAAVIVAGSTLAGEEAMLLAQWPQLSARHPNAILLLAPRHPERFAEVEALIRTRGFTCLRCSSLGSISLVVSPATVLLLDTLGDLASMYAIAAVAFIGGSLVPKGGHNPLEATRFGMPVLMGPSYENFREMVEPMIANGLITIIHKATLGGALADALDHPRRAQPAPVGESSATLRTFNALREMVVEDAGGGA